MPKSDRLVPNTNYGDNVGIDGYSAQVSMDDGDGGEIGFDIDQLNGKIDMNFYPLHVGPTKMAVKPDFVPYLDINKVLVIKYRRAKGLSVSNLCNISDSNDHQSQSSDESLDSRGRPKRCPRPRLHKKILDMYGI